MLSNLVTLDVSFWCSRYGRLAFAAMVAQNMHEMPHFLHNLISVWPKPIRCVNLIFLLGKQITCLRQEDRDEELVTESIRSNKPIC